MRNVLSLALLGAGLLITGCGDLLSLHALYTEQDNVFDPALEGRWENKDELLIVQRESPGYIATLQSKKTPSELLKYEVRLVEIKGVRFADILPVDAVGHMFVRVRVTDDQLRIAFFDTKWLRQQVPHEEADVAEGKKQAMLTAHTPELRSLVARYASEPKAFDDGMEFRRMK
jgi:hypothetical protein